MKRIHSLTSPALTGFRNKDAEISTSAPPWESRTTKSDRTSLALSTSPARRCAATASCANRSTWRDKSKLEHVFTAAVELEDEQSVLAGVRRRTSPHSFPRRSGGRRRASNCCIIVPSLLARGPPACSPPCISPGTVINLCFSNAAGRSASIPDVKAFDDGGPLNPESNYLFGEGGAGTFSDGKLTCRTTGPDADEALRVFASSKGKPSVVYEAKPHLGSNRLPAVVKSLRRQIVEAGGETRFGARVVDLECQSGRIVGVVTEGEMIPCDVVILAVGHSARRLSIATTPCRANDRQTLSVWRPHRTAASERHEVQYGAPALERILGPADYSMKVCAGECDLFTFCMCAGGYVMPIASQDGFFCTNGMSRSKHESPFANSGLVTTIDPALLGSEFGGDALSGMRFQESLDAAPLNWAAEIMSRRFSGPKTFSISKSRFPVRQPIPEVPRQPISGNGFRGLYAIRFDAVSLSWISAGTACSSKMQPLSPRKHGAAARFASTETRPICSRLALKAFTQSARERASRVALSRRHRRDPRRPKYRQPFRPSPAMTHCRRTFAFGCKACS